ncbi:molecular chaperone HtpG [Bauldia sp.]|uniref:molecular chaperone HtpG n=1 Tax=Bauldia sp. TaxID=2575872 RepID=UPI0025BD7BD1|nr:molecular chaperone HtpG [Bauldia sp.]
MVEQMGQAGETLRFEAEVTRLLSLMVHSVYSNRDVFLRELISNAADACEKLRMMALEQPELLGDDPDFKIVLSADHDGGTLVIEDNGIGMDRDELVGNLGTIARSGTRAFLEGAAGGEGSALIGQFGVGFYSAFMVASSVEVVSRQAGSAEAWRWWSDGTGTFQLEPVPIEEAPARGTRVLLTLKDDAKTYAEQATIERVVAEYSAHVPVPIWLRIGGDGVGEKTLADGSALWRKSKSAVGDSEYAEFYGHVSGQYDEPALTIHYKAEGRHEYSVLLFVPSMRPFDLFDPERRGRVRLYVRRVYITDEAAILPGWLRFVRGVIDSEDLPLNLSREMLQKNPILEAIGKGVTSRILAELDKLAESDGETFEKVWTSFGAVIKEGLYEDAERRDGIYRIARFRTTRGDGWRSLADYIADLRPNQTAIYYALGDDLDAIKASPQLEGFAKRGIEVLLLSDPVDAFWVRTALGYDGKPFQSVTQGAADLDKVPVAEGEAETEAASDSAVATLAALFKQTLGERVSDVRASSRLTSSPVCLVAGEAGPDRQLEKILSAQNQAMPRGAPILELNPGHALIKGLAEKAAAGGKTETLEDAAVLLYGEARILDGEAPENPADHVARVGKLLAAALG